jgi:uncharacterized protein (TIGR03083 family)
MEHVLVGPGQRMEAGRLTQRRGPAAKEVEVRAVVLWHAVRVSAVADDTVTSYATAARTFARLVRAIPAGRWDRPGLGEWDLRSLVGHTSRSLTTVWTYLHTAAEREDIASPQEYYVRVKAVAAGLGPPAVVERGRQAGKDLGTDPATSVDALVESVLGQLADREDRLIQVIGGLGIRLSAYLPTRTFELAVHGLDIAAALDIQFSLPEKVLSEATVLAARIALASGDGSAVLTSLTGRTTLPASFSVV